MNRTFRAMLGAASIAALLCACAVGPTYRAPYLGLTPNFHTPPPPIAPVVQGSNWWESFKDPDLRRIVERASRQNLDLAQAQARLVQSRATMRAATAALLPTAGVDVSAARVNQSLNSPIGAIGRHLPGFARDGDDDAAMLGASWELDLFGGLRRRQEGASAQAKASAADLAALRVAVTADAADAYLQVRALQRRITIARRLEQDQKAIADLFARRRDEGVSSDREAREARAALEAVQSSIPSLTEALEATLNRLDVLMGVQPGTYRREIEVARDIPTPGDLAFTGAPADLLRRRPDLVAAEQRVRAANAGIGAALSEYYPKVSLEALAGFQSIATASLFHQDSEQALGRAGLKWRLFDFGRIDAEVAAAKGREAQALLAYRQLVFRAAEEVEDSFSNLAEERHRILALQGQIRDLEGVRSQSHKAYEGGVVGQIDVLQADRNLLAATDQLDQARLSEARAAVASFRALGGDGVGPRRE